jgi:predicted RNA-binding Zn ribbon-like protein
MRMVPSVAPAWLVGLVNEYAQPAREAAGEDRDPYPAVMDDPMAPRIPRVARRDLIDIAQRLWLLFASESEAERAALFNDLLDDAELSPGVSEDAELIWMTRRTDAGGLLLAGCAAALLGVIGEHGWGRLGVCAGYDCLDVYLDEAGRGTRRYCSATCLNRSRVRAYRYRQRATRADS